MKRLFCAFLAALLLATSFHVSATESTGTVVSTTFTSTTAVIPNQERGWYDVATYSGDYFDCQGMTSGALSNVYNEGSRLAVCALNLVNYVNTDTIDSTFLNTTVPAFFALARAAHVKLIVRPVYSYGPSPGPDTTVARMTLHMQQLKADFLANADVTAYVEDGLVGAFGEWHDSTTFGSTNTVAANGTSFRSIHQAVQANIHPRTMDLIRYPRYPYAWYTSQLTATTAFSGSEQGRGGIHNDCLEGDPGDGGTFLSSDVSPVTNTERARLATESNYHPYGGEGCAGSATRFTCSATSGIMYDGPIYHLTFMNLNTNSSGLPGGLSSGGCYNTVGAMMGYRFQYDSVSHQGTAAAGQTLTFNVLMRNYGWSRIFSERRVKVCLFPSTGGTTTCTASALSAVDLRTLPPQATSSTPIPVSGLVAPAAGTYNVGLCLPDFWPNLTAIADYAIHPANTDSGSQAWNSTTGCEMTGTQVVTH